MLLDSAGLDAACLVLIEHLRLDLVARERLGLDPSGGEGGLRLVDVDRADRPEPGVQSLVVERLVQLEAAEAQLADQRACPSGLARPAPRA